MKCSVCQKEMQIKNKYTSNNQKQESEHRKYQRVLYWCDKDDVWIGVETPILHSKNLA